MIVDPATARADAAAINDAISHQRYGTLGINVWSAVGFLLGLHPWEPTQATPDTRSAGVGLVHNAFMLHDVEKTVLPGPFALTPRGLFTSSPSLSLRPPYFVTNRTADRTLQRVTRFTAAPNPLHLPAIFASALRG